MALKYEAHDSRCPTDVSSQCCCPPKQMSRENANASVPPSIENHSSEYAGLIEWYDSPKVFLASQAKMPGSGRLVKARSAEDFSPSRSLVTGTPSTSDFDILWCDSSPQEDVKQYGGGDGNTTTNLINGVSHDNATSATPRRCHQVSKLLRRRRLRTEQLSSDENNAVSSEKCLSMEEGLAIGKASLVKLRQRLNSEKDSSVAGKPDLENPHSDPLKAIQQCSPNISPISSLPLLKGKIVTVLTPSMARSQPPQFFTSTPKTTSLKRYQTMDNGAIKDVGVKRKVAHTKSMDIVDEISDDDSFLNDIFVPFTHPSQYVEMLKQGFVKR